MKIEDRVKAVRALARKILTDNPSTNTVTIEGDGYEVTVERNTK